MTPATSDRTSLTLRADDTRRIVAHVSDLMRAEYLEMPCLSLTLPQAMRLWSVDRRLCELGLAALVHEGFLERSEDGMYRRSPLGFILHRAEHGATNQHDPR
jgi:hypothetical protein